MRQLTLQLAIVTKIVLFQLVKSFATSEEQILVIYNELISHSIGSFEIQYQGGKNIFLLIITQENVSYDESSKGIEKKQRDKRQFRCVTELLPKELTRLYDSSTYPLFIYIRSIYPPSYDLSSSYLASTHLSPMYHLLVKYLIFKSHIYVHYHLKSN